MGRILDYPEKPSPGLNDYLLVDSSSEGTKKISAGNIVTVDSSLTQPGQPADAKKTGDEIASVKADLGNIPAIDPTLTVSGQTADAKVTGDAIKGVKSDLSSVEDDFYKLSFETVIDTTDTGSYETAPEATVAVPHLYAFKARHRYKLEVIINTASFKNITDALRADTSRAVNDSTANINTELFRVNYSQIYDGANYVVEFIALETDKNILMRYKFDAGVQNITVKVYEYIGTNNELDALKSRVDTCEDNISEIKDAIQHTNVCIDVTDTGSYETAPSTRNFVHLYPFVAGKKYKATLTINHAVFLYATDAIRVQQSATTNDSSMSNLGFVFRLNASQITDGAVFETEFIAGEGCVNLLARYKFDAGEQSIDLDVTLTEYVSTDVEDIKKDVRKKYDECIIKSRMLMGAHRGAESFAPPNSVAAYEIAGKMGFPWAWLAQIRWSASGTLYVMHDADVSITTNGTGNIQDLTDEYISSLLCNKIQSYDYSKFSDADLRVPTLEKAIQICLRYGMKMCFRIEPFPNQIETELHQQIWDNFETLIKEYGISADWCCYSGYNVAEMTRCITLFGENAEICPFLGTSISTAQDVVDWFNAITSVTIKRKAVLLPGSDISLEDVKLLHRNEIKVYAFTNSTTPSQELMENLATWGVDILQNPRYARIP